MNCGGFVFLDLLLRSNRFIYQLIYQFDIMILVGEYIGKKVGKSMSLTDKIIELCSYDDEQLRLFRPM